MLYALAKARGYTPKATAPAPEQKMEQLEQGQAAARDIASSPGRQTKSITLQSLIEMDDDAFYKISSNPRAFKRLFGEA